MLIPTTNYGFVFCRKLGTVGAAVIAVGGVLAGVQSFTDPLGKVPGIRELRESTVFSVLVVYIGLTLLLGAWWRIGALIHRPDGPSWRELAGSAVWWGAPLTLLGPVFSGDVYSYIAQGAMTVVGIDAYRYGPAAMGGPLNLNVPPIWQDTPAPYGPVFLDLAGSVTRVTGELTWPGVVGMRVLAIVGVGMLVWSVPRIARYCGVEPNAALWLGVLNPLVLLHLVADAHNDSLMLGLMSVGLVLVIERHPVPGCALIAFAGLVKAPGGLAIAFVVPIWARYLKGRLRWGRAGLGAVSVAGATVVAATALADTGYGWVHALNTPTRAHTWLSITTDLGSLTGYVGEWLGLTTVDAAMHAWWTVGLGAAACVFVELWRRSPQIGPVAALGLSLGALVMLGPVVHPWYLLWAIVPLAMSGSATVRRWVAVLSVALVVFVLPGGVQPGIPALTGAVMGTGAVLVGFVVLTGLGRRQFLAPLVIGGGGGNVAVPDLRWLRPVGSTASATVALEPVAAPSGESGRIRPATQGH
ncbi:polyprenol phosphomannose-dependent alpha 1,6 mannosyltransferase MptB [Planosporangium mesophilum]|uniref:Membrane protein n=1 Tax=Planosporangium mesophilum TaxID=689768 RepID=A0A8J3X2F7_9ACTN|nr:polyprenol phosphomannose-dependent alpha 1,6 mannosyltransferase MptB [Planosporangium mesophilum]NJC86614.1 polyprenol phosphomannose-dependent alpha 1,6 mannosyltransferase MptB [Planosporangium mesophilum]GII25400.1 membrane protein [Planosporangium mesophilum]